MARVVRTVSNHRTAGVLDTSAQTRTAKKTERKDREEERKGKEKNRRNSA